MDREFADLERRYHLARARSGMDIWKKIKLPEGLTGEVFVKKLTDTALVKGEISVIDAYIRWFNILGFPKPYKDEKSFLIAIPSPEFGIPIGNNRGEIKIDENGQMFLEIPLGPKHKFSFSYLTAE